jgi:hypothetical protein
MIRGLGDETFSAYSQTLNGQVTYSKTKIRIEGIREVKGDQSILLTNWYFVA